MKYSTGRKKRSRLQGHRKRRRVPDISRVPGVQKLAWTEYKTLRQFQAVGDLLDALRDYGHLEFREMTSDATFAPAAKNGHIWLTEDPDQ